MAISTMDSMQRLALLRALPLFSEVPDVVLLALAQLFVEVNFHANQVIVQEHDIVDDIYIIVDGTAEVSHQTNHNGQLQTDILAKLDAGEAIGLSHTGFYSETGARTATVKAITPIAALRLSLDNFKQFLSINENLNAELLKAANLILKEQFIKQVEPFQKIDDALLKEIASEIKELNVAAGEMIITQGDEADECYFLRSGTVDIIITKADNTDTQIASLKETGTLFGESALLTHSKRNASVRAATDCQLFALSRQQFETLTQRSLDVSTELTNMLLDRHRPVAYPDVTIHTRTSKDNEILVILKDAARGIYFKTNEEGLFVWKLLDGEHTIMNIAVEYYYLTKRIATASIGDLIRKLMHSGLVQMPPLAEHVDRLQQPLLMRVLSTFSRAMQFHYDVHQVDDKLSWLYAHGGYLFYTKLANLIMIMIAIFGMIPFVVFAPQTETILKMTPHAWTYLIWMLLGSMILIPLHELAHGLTTKAYGREVHRMGVGWFWFGPMAFTDTSDMWLDTRWPRIIVNVAGIYFNWVISGVLACVAWLCFPALPHAAVFFWLVAFSSYLMGLYNLDPLFELDGYYMLMNYFDKSNLRAKAVVWLIEDFKKTLFQPSLACNFIPEIIYWVLSISFIFIYAGIACLTYTYVFSSIFLHHTPQHHYIDFKWVVTILVIILAFASVYFNVKRQRHLFHR